MSLDLVQPRRRLLGALSVVLVSLLFALPSSADNIQFTVLPELPIETMPLRIVPFGVIDGVTSVAPLEIEVDGSDIFLRVETTGDPFGASPPVEIDFAFDLGPLGSAGTYRVVLQAVDDTTGERRTVAEDSIFVTPGVDILVADRITTTDRPIPFAVAGTAECLAVFDQPMIVPESGGGGRVVVLMGFGDVCASPPGPLPFRFDFEIADGLASGQWVFEAIELDGRQLGRAVVDVLGEPPVLQDGRFRVDVSWRDFDGATGVGSPAVPSTVDSTLLWFFAPENWEMTVKVLDGCGVNGHYWVFGSASTNVEYELTVTDTQTAAVWTLSNPLGELSPAFADVEAFACDGL
ncbi:MAG: hypothetical protein AAGC60_10575 [Acidobacteriota bacterium]